MTRKGKNLLSRGAMILVFNSRDEVYVHKRPPNKKVFPGLYNLFFGGGLLSGESYEDGASRELYEETGIKLKPEFMFKFRRPNSDIAPGFVCVYQVVYDGELKLDENEAEEGFFIKKSELEEFMKSHEFCQESVLAYTRCLEIMRGKQK